MRLTAKQKQLVLAFAGKAETPAYVFGGLAVAIARLRKIGLLSGQYLSPYGEVVATAILNKQPIPSREAAVQDAIARAQRHP